MVKLKFVGNGLFSRGIKFTPDKNDGLYTVSSADATYLLKTFPDMFITIERKAETKEAEVVETKETPKKRTRRKKDD